VCSGGRFLAGHELRQHSVQPVPVVRTHMPRHGELVQDRCRGRLHVPAAADAHARSVIIGFVLHVDFVTSTDRRIKKQKCKVCFLRVVYVITSTDNFIPKTGCSRMDLRQRVVPDASQLCAVSLHAGASSRSVSAQYDWNYLAAAPCILISMGNAYCYEINR